MGFDPQETTKLADFFLVRFIRGQLLDPLVETLNLPSQKIEGKQIFVQDRYKSFISKVRSHMM